MTVKDANRILTKIFGPFYSPMRILSYGRYLLFTVGIRSIGKSTGWAIYFLIMFMSRGRKWIYVRRTDKELHKSAKEYFDTAAEIIRDEGFDCEVKYDGGRYYVNGELAGSAIPLAQQQQYRGAVLGNTWYILYDEFMIVPGTTSFYMGGRENMSSEVTALLGLRETADRKKGCSYRNEVICICAGNAGTYFNPFFIYYGIDQLLRPDTKYLAPKGELWVLEQTFSTEATKLIEESVAYKLSRGAHREYAFNNRYADTQDIKFIEKMSGDKIPMCNLIYEGKSYGVWAMIEDSMLYVTTETVDGDYPNYALTTRDHAPNYLMLQRYTDSRTTIEIKRMYDMGLIRFKNAKCKLVLDFFLRYAII